jgi:hypothetical protein
MSRHRIVHTFDANDIVSEFDGDDYEEEGEEELSQEDRQAMDEGTAEVRRVLGTEANKVTSTNRRSFVALLLRYRQVSHVFDEDIYCPGT